MEEQEKKYDQYRGYYGDNIPFLGSELIFEHPTDIVVNEGGIVTIEDANTKEIKAIFSGQFNIRFYETITE